MPTAASYCSTPTYNGSSQTIVKTAGTGYTWTAGTTRTAAGSQNVTATLSSGYRWSDNGTGTKTISCSIAQATPTVTLAASGKNFTEKANVAGTFANKSGSTGIATISPASYSSVAANTAKTVTVTAVANGSSVMTVTFTPTDTTNYKTASKTITATVSNATPTYTCSSGTLSGACCYSGTAYYVNHTVYYKTSTTSSVVSKSYNGCYKGKESVPWGTCMNSLRFALDTMNPQFVVDCYGPEGGYKVGSTCYASRSNATVSKYTCSSGTVTGSKCVKY